MRVSGKIEIRRAVPEDARGIALVHVRTWQTTYVGILEDSYLANLEENEGEQRRVMWGELLTGDRTKRDTFVAEGENGIVGFVDFGALPPPSQEGEAELYALYVIKEQQGFGIGRGLFERAIWEMRRLGIHTFSLLVVRGNPSEGFYRRMGGVPEVENKERFNRQGLVEIKYRWKCAK